MTIKHYNVDGVTLSEAEKEMLLVTEQLHSKYPDFASNPSDGSLDDLIKVSGLLMELVDGLAKAPESFTPAVMREGITHLALRIVQNVMVQGVKILNSFEEDLGDPASQMVLKAFALNRLQDSLAAEGKGSDQEMEALLEELKKFSEGRG